ncbi:Pentatricopeptide repeat-containing protein [Apostasia shenzhenica]|uniref:Pentatricopeptide repeat-containing protein n=1 Tax=Apostasia shenzhenica TaxID=1088818 RepID=A0A2I0ADH7_9ASPA|nr:Pentatricopeptide repeat-containing protein [Apostasia shenzhenica]
MFKGFTEGGLHEQTVLFFTRMKKRDVRPDIFTFPFVIKSCAMIPSFILGVEIHCFAVKTGLDANAFFGTSLIEMYASLGDVRLGYKVFEEMPERNLVVWTAIIRSYLSIGDTGTARHLFDQLEERDLILWNTMISGYIEHGDMASAQKLFEEMPAYDIMSWNTLLLAYASKDIEACERFFEQIPERNVFSWNGMIGAYARHGQFSDILKTFRRMLASSDVKPSDATLVSVLSSCSKLGALNWGRWIHVYAENNGFKGNIYVGNGLIDMYAKCGCIQTAIQVFDSMEKRDAVTWNSMISSLAMHGMGLEALKLFEEMLEDGEKPDGIAFVGALTACAHLGLVDRAFGCFRSMIQTYSIAPWIEHYGCMVDLLCRAGLLEEAMRLVRKMPMEADDVIWSNLLAGSRDLKDINSAEMVMSKLVKIVPEDVGNYALMSNVYGDVGRWEDFRRLQKMVRRTNGSKTPGCSLVEVNMEVVEFCSSDARHVRSKDIYQILEGLMDNSRFVASQLSDSCQSSL